MATLTLPVEEKKKIYRAGSPDHRRRGHCDCLQTGQRRRSHGLPDPALRHGDAVHQPVGSRWRNGLRIYRGGRRAFSIRNREARVGLRSARVLRFERRGLDVRHGSADRKSGSARPMVCMVGNRALDDPGAFGVEHNDALAVRDLGWLLTWVDSAQEALDTALIAYRVAEDRRIFVPLAISCDGAFLTHSQALVQDPGGGAGQEVPATLQPRRSAAPS